ncbi:MAG: hypothetical protein Q9182_000167 [Xanthomendoza sp. 2 TL-2023]
MAVNSGSGHLDLTKILQNNVDDLRNLVACRICIRPMYEPYTTQCGHTFCYSCLRQWFDRDHTKKTCPDCRAHVQHQPAPAYLVREMTQLFTNTAVLLPAGETTEDHKKSQIEEARLVEEDKANHDTGGGLFNGRFKGRCTWELEYGVCNGCGYITDALVNNLADLDDQSMNSEAPSYTSSAIEEILSNDDDLSLFDDEEHRRRDAREHVRQRARRPVFPHNRRMPHGSGAETSDDDDDDFTNDSASVGSLRDFLADDMAVDDADADAESGHSSEANSHMNPYDSGTEEPWDVDENEPLSPGADRRSDTNSTTIPRRFRRRPVALSSPDRSDSDQSDSTHPYWPNSQQHEEHGGFSPLQSEPDGGHSQDVPIQIDSDSDVPVVRRRRMRPTTLSVSSDSEDNGARGVNILRSHSSRASSNGTARNHNRSSASSVANPSRPPASTNSPDSQPSPIRVVSSPARRHISSHFQSIRPYASRRSRPTASDFFEDNSVYDSNNTDNRSGLESSRNTPTAPSEDNERLRSRIVRRREQSEQRMLLSPPQRHNAEERKRLKMRRRARAQQGRSSRGDVNHQVHPQRLAYIDV